MVQEFLAWSFAPVAGVLGIMWFMFAVFSSIGAAQKGRSGAGWFVVGLMFGFFGLLVYAMPNLNAPKRMTQRQRATMPAPRASGDLAWVLILAGITFAGVMAVSATVV